MTAAAAFMSFYLVAAPIQAQAEHISKADTLNSASENMKRPPLSFRVLQWGYVAADGVDAGMTITACLKYGYQESNCLFDPHRPLQMLAISAALDFAVVGLENVLWKNSKPIAWAVAIAAVLVKGYVIYRNIQTLGR